MGGFTCLTLSNTWNSHVRWISAVMAKKKKRSYFSPHSPSHTLQRSTPQTSYVPSHTSSAFKNLSFWQKHSKGSFCLPAAVSCQNTQVAAMSTINMMYSLCSATDLTTRAKGVRGSRCHADLWHLARTFTLRILSCPSEQRVWPVVLNTFTPPWQNSRWEKYTAWM